MARSLDVIDCEIREVKGRTFKHLGDLLIEIVDRKLYQDRGFTNVEDYFQSEPNLPSARQAFRLISATRFARQLPTTVPQPKSERQVRPLLGRKRDEAKLLWAIATVVATERQCTLDGKLVSTVVKEFDDGLLQEYVPEACRLLGAASLNLEELQGKPSGAKRQKRRDANGAASTRARSEEPWAELWETTLHVAETIQRLHGAVMQDRALPQQSALRATILRDSLANAASGRKRTRSDAAQTRERQMNAILGDALGQLVHLVHLFEHRATSHAALAENSALYLSQQSGDAFPEFKETATGQQGSSEDELSVAEALLTMSNFFV